MVTRRVSEGFNVGLAYASGCPIKPQAQAVICSGSRYHNTRSVGWIAVLVAAGFLAADHLGL